MTVYKKVGCTLKCAYMEDESGKGACYPENNVKKILCERDENTKKKIGGVVGATKEILE